MPLFRPCVPAQASAALKSLVVLCLLLVSNVLFAQPVITSFTPISGPVGSTVTISGTNFSSVAANNTVRFGATKAAVTAATSTTLTVTVPTGATFEPVTVTANGLTAYAPQAFCVTFSGGNITDTTFKLLQDYATNKDSWGIASCDIDGDGKPDMLTVGTRIVNTETLMNVYRNTSTTGNISFAAPVSIAGAGLIGLCTGDLDGDGKPDVVALNYDKIVVLRNTSTPGSISFTTTTYADLDTVNNRGANPVIVAIGDLDGDGKPEVVTADRNLFGIGVFKNNSTPGNIALAARTEFYAGNMIMSVSIGDIDGDQKPDVVVPCLYDHKVAILKNESSGGSISLVATQGIPFTSGPNVGILADLDNDGKSEIIVGKQVTTRETNYVSVFKNVSTPGNISLGTETLLQTNISSVLSIVAADVNGDGKPDLTVASESVDTLNVFRNTGTPGNISFAPRNNIALKDYNGIGMGPMSIVLSDFDGDSKPDIATANYTGRSSSIYRNVSVNPQLSPTIASCSPLSATAGTSVTIKGANFTGTTAVHFGNVATGSFTVNSDTQITAVVGAGASGYVRVTTLNGKDSLAGFTFLYAPDITSFSPASGAQGTSVTIKGVHLTGTTAVYFGNVAAGSFNVDSDTQITAVVGQGATGYVRIVAPNGADSLTGFTYYATPVVITSFIPVKAGPAQTITIKGLRFTGVTDVSFGGVSAAFSIINDTVILAKVGASGASGDVMVKSPLGPGSKSGFTFIPPPTITTLSPMSGPIGTTVTITGTNFSTVPSDNTVYFGTVKATVLSATGTTLTVTVPTSASYQPVTVTTNQLTAYSDKSFNVTFPGVALDNSSYASELDIKTGEAPRTLLSGDLDGDGKPDLVLITVDNPPYRVTVYRNTSTAGKVSFDAPSSFFINTVAVDITLADMTGDGKLDIVASKFYVYGLTVYENQSTPGHLAFSNYSTYAGTYPAAVAVGDLDLDGRPDVVAAEYDQPLISVLRNESVAGTTEIGTGTNYSLGDVSSSVAIVDVDGDGKPDVITAGNGAPDIIKDGRGTVSIYRNNSVKGAVSFFTRLDYKVVGAKQVKFADIDGDKKPDMLVAGEIGAVFVYKNTSSPGNISFAPKINAEGFTGYTSIGAIEDMDGDGKPDLGIVGNTFSANDSIAVLVNTSTGGNISFTKKTGIKTRQEVTGFVATDLDGDNRPDIAIINDSLISIHRFVGKAPSITSFSPATGGAGTEITIVGVNLGGTTAVSIGSTPVTSFTVVDTSTVKAIVAPGVTGDVIITTNLGTANKAQFTFINVPSIISFSPTKAQPGDTVTITGTTLTLTTGVTFGGIAATSFTVVDSTTIKAVVSYGATGSVEVTTVGGAISKTGFILNLPVIANVTPYGAAPGATVTVTGINFNPNAADNVVYFGAVQAKVNSASGTSLQVTVPVGATYAPVSVTAYNRTTYSTQPFMPTFDGAGSVLGDSSFNGKTKYTINYGPQVVHMSDLDGDNKPDLIAGNTSTSSTGINIMRNTGMPGTVSFAPRVFYPVSGSTNAINTGDFDGDGKQDVVVCGPGGDKILIYQNTSTPGNIALQPAVSYQTGQRPQSIAIEDFNGDGKPDMAIVNYYSDDISIFVNTTKGNSISFVWQYTVNAGSTPGEVRVGDVDGDGKADLLVSNQGLRVNSFSVFRNISSAGAVAFGNRMDFYTDSQAYPTTIALGDLDADGKPDVVVGNYAMSTLSVFKNISTPGSVGFSPRTDYAAGSNPAQVNIGDMDGDGKPDVVMAGSGSVNGPSVISFYRNISTPATVSLAQQIQYTAGKGTADVFIGDADGDSKPDLVAANYDENTVVVMRNGLNEITSPVPVPSISSFMPSSGSAGTTVIIKGHNFIGTTMVTFGGTPAASFTVISDSVIYAGVGSGSSGDVEIRSVDGTGKMGRFEYLSAAPPMVVAPNPASGYTILTHPLSINNSVIKLNTSMGILVKTIKVDPGIMQTRIDLTGVAPGMYVIWWGDGNSAASKTILVQ